MIWIVASPSISLWTFQYSICGLSCGKVVSSTSSLSADVRNLQFDRRRIDQRVGPGELQRVDALLERHDARLADQRDVLAVVDRELHGIAPRDGREIDVLGEPGEPGSSRASAAMHERRTIVTAVMRHVMHRSYA